MKIRKYTDGIYYLEGDAIPVQVVVTKELSGEEYYWLQNLRTDLKAGKEIEELVKRYEENKASHYYQAVMDLLVRANWKQMEEERNMCEALRELFADELKEAENTGMRKGMQKGMQKGENRGIWLAKEIFKLSGAGSSAGEIAVKCGISEQRVLEILND